VLALLGRSAWWLPGWLERALPDLDVEGSKLPTPTPVDAQASRIVELAR